MTEITDVLQKNREEDFGEESTAEEVELDQYLVFSIEGQEFGFQAVKVQEISSIPDITDVPNAPDHIEGIMNLRGTLASVVNFRKRFNFEERPHDEDTRIVIVEHEGFSIGVIVDSVEEVIKIPADSVQKLPEGTASGLSKEYMTGVGVLGKRLIILLDSDEILEGSQLPDAGDLKAAMAGVKAAAKGKRKGAKGKAEGREINEI